MYEKLLKEIEKEKSNIKIIEMPFTGNIKGLYADNVIAINKNIDTYKERTCILAEELGHYYTTVGNILDQSILDNRKQELKAKRWAIDRLICVEDFIDAFNAGTRNRAELAEFLDVTESFIEMALKHFEVVYGQPYTIGEYIIHFNPLYIYKNLETT